ncbi:MAG TPA: DUF4142 domain-containing protein [Polyangiales bacterium]|nr:DUF4142 domain-containing protein [Polyangiales bacterium]
MSIKQCLRHVGFSLVVVSALLSGCEDDSDNSIEEEAQTADDDESTGSSGTSTRAGRSGGSAGTAGRAAGAAGRAGGRGGAGATTGDADQGGRGSTRGGRGGDNDNDEGGRTGAGGRISTPGGSGGTGGTEDSDDAGVAIIELNDGQIAEITSVVNTGEISLNTLAATRAIVPAAQDYAQAMVAMHTTAQERQTALVNSLGITASSSALSARLTEDVARIRTTLESAEALDFDLLYIRTQVDLHARVLLTIDEQLLPNVTAEQLRAELVVARAEVAMHLQEAQTILATLEVGDTDAGVP